MVANAVTCRIQFWKKFQIANRYVHHIEEGNVFINLQNQVGKTSNDKKP